MNGRDPRPSFVRAQEAFTRHLRAPAAAPAPADVPDARMALYRELVYGNVERMLANLFPVLRKVTPDDTWFARVREYFQSHACGNGLFTRVAREFVSFLESVPPDPARPFELELARYECLDYEVTIDPCEIDFADIDADGDLLAESPVVNPLARLCVFAYPVQRIGPDYVPTAPSAVPTCLVVSRDRDDRVAFIDVNPLTARLLELARERPGHAGHALLDALAAEIGHLDPAHLRAAGRDILTRLRARDVLLGTRA